jgi:selenocysteine lyase/cysteine desulfurase
MNATQALNLALAGLLGSEDILVTTAFDHNAVLRPAHLLERSRGVRVRMARGRPDGSIDMDHLEELLDGAKVLVVNEASNVLGTRLPLREMAELAHASGALVLVDAAQSAGHLPTRPAVDGGDVVAVAGHKGLLGPQGTGALWVREGVELAPLLAGGTGGDSTRRDMPETLPDRLEPGTPNVAGAVGLAAGIEFLMERGLEALHDAEAKLKARLHDGMERIRGLNVLSPPDPGGTGIVTVVADSVDPATLGRRLEAEWGVLCRTGIHCAPEVHRMLGTERTGAVRLSLGWASTEADVDRALEGVEAIVGPTRVFARSASVP